MDPDSFVIPDRNKIGEVIPRISGSLSAISSILIILLVARSSTGFSSTYHRIMVGMSIADVCSSTAIAFTHLLMPRPGLSDIVDAYGYEGKRIGNFSTCTVQGFLFASGTLTTYGYNTALCMYFASTIFFKMKKRMVRNRVEPILHAVWIVSFALTIPHLPNHSYNPLDAWCQIGKKKGKYFRVYISSPFFIISISLHK